jgi:hypothetical protein
MRKTLCLAVFASAALFVSNGFTQSPLPKPEPLTIPPKTVAPATMPIPAAYFPPQAVPTPAIPPAMPSAAVYSPPRAVPTPAMPPAVPPAAHPAPAMMEWMPASASPALSPLVTKVISIGDVILQTGTSGTKHALEDRAERLTNLLEGFIAPQSWTSAGGRGSMVYFATNHTLVVNNEERIVRDVETWIDRLRDASKPTVSVSIHQFRCAPGALAKLGYDAKKGPCLTATQRDEALKALQADPSFELLTAPRLAVCENQTGYCQIGQAVPSTGPAHAAPFVGTTFRATPRIAPDGKTITVRVESEWTELAPITVNATPMTAVARECTNTTVAVPSGGTAIVPMGTKAMVTKTEWKVPVLGDVPVVESLFRGRCTETKDCDLFLFVTAAPLTGPGATAMPPMPRPEPKPAAVRYVATLPQPTKGPTACELVAEYRKACAEGRTDDAKALAVRALSLDPKCFTEK